MTIGNELFKKLPYDIIIYGIVPYLTGPITSLPSTTKDKTIITIANTCKEWQKNPAWKELRGKAITRLHFKEVLQELNNWAKAKEELNTLISTNNGFKLSGLDYETTLLINKTNITITKQILPLLAVFPQNIFFFQDVYNNFTSTAKSINSYCPDNNLLIEVPCYAVGSYLALTLHMLKSIPFAFPVVLGSFLKPTVMDKPLKILTFINDHPETSTKRLPLYARCFAKTKRIFNKARTIVKEAFEIHITPNFIAVPQSLMEF